MITLLQPFISLNNASTLKNLVHYDFSSSISPVFDLAALYLVERGEAVMY